MAKIQKNSEKEIVEAPVVTTTKDTITVHNYTTLKGKIVLDRTKASMLYLELHKFLMSNEK